MAVAVTIGLVFYPGSPTMQARVSNLARESVLACCRGLFSAGRQTVRGSPLALFIVAFKRSDALRLVLSTQLLALRFPSLLAWTVYRCSS